MTSIGHLAIRFFRSFRARRPGPADQAFVAGALRPGEAEVFWAQPTPDLDHAVRAARVVATVLPGRPDLLRAALLHDVGKRWARLGTVGRSLATALGTVRLPVTRRMRTYLEHAEAGAVELEGLGSDPLIVSFTRHHHGRRPEAVSPTDWTVLLEADAE